MNFSTPIFLFLFLPVVLTLYYCIRPEMRNALLLLASLLFYAWAGVWFLLVLAGSILVNHAAAILIASMRDRGHGRLSSNVLILGVAANLGLLAFFKYSDFLTLNLETLGRQFGVLPLTVPSAAIPLGLSFITFKAISYLVDVSRNHTTPHRNLMITALYLSVFPQVIAGPISRYGDLAPQCIDRSVTLENLSRGVERFIIGLAKKVLVANAVAGVADRIFMIPVSHLTCGVAWLGAVCYTFQIYFDFSGYTDMAIGLGLMFGFTFVENFNYPYISRSITEFWHRWHISLSTWLRDYLFLPIAYSLSRRFDAHKLFGVQRDPVFWSYIIGTLATMSLAGLWHGPNWTFVVWGAVFGLFLVFERSRPGKRIKSLWPPLRHGYALIVIIAAWVVFRSDSLPAAFGYLRSMFGFATGDGKNYFPAMYLNNELIIVLCAALVGSMPVAKLVGRRFPATGVALPHTYRFARTLFTAFILIVSLLTLAGGTNNPFIYFRF